ncbi:MAG TPA: patatin-like phospholipase family protein [Candidatus Tectomicrobia bacterium]|nr:patatin-like phospholipase family protein [Candidatus Tectomicrobia bacterium]
MAGDLLHRGVMRFLGSVRDVWRRPRRRPRYALALAGGGIIGGMYEVGAMAALEERLGGPCAFDVYVGCSAGSVVAALLASGIPAGEIYRVLDQDLDDPLNFRRGTLFAVDAWRRAWTRFGRLLWVLGKHSLRGGTCIPDVLARAEGQLPSGFFSLVSLEAFMRRGLASRGRPNEFAALQPTLLVPAVDLDTAERAVFGVEPLRDVPISQAVAASSAIPGFFDPYRINGRNYVDGGVGFCGHADLAAEAGAEVVFVVNPLVPTLVTDGLTLGARGIYTILEQASRIYSQNLLTLGLTALSARFPRTRFFLLQPPRSAAALFGPSMGFEASRAALRFGCASAREWLDAQGAPLLERLLPRPVAATV